MKSPALGLLFLLALIRVPRGVRASEARVGGAAIAEISEEPPSSAITAEEGEAAPRRLRKGRDKCKDVAATNTKLVEWCYKQCEGCKCVGCNDIKRKRLEKSRWCRSLDCSSFTIPADTTNVRTHSLKMCDPALRMSDKKRRWCQKSCRFCRGTSKCDSDRNPDKPKEGCNVNNERENSELTRCQNLGCDPDDNSSNLNSRMGVLRANPFDGGDGDDPDDDDDTSDLDAEFLVMMADFDPYIGLAGEARGSL